MSPFHESFFHRAHSPAPMRPEDFAIADSFHTHVGIDPRATHEELAVAAGIVSRKELARMGFVTDRQIRAGIQTRQFTRIAHGRYALPHAHANARTAARHNARVTCLSACEMYGLWVPKQSELHVAIRRSSPYRLVRASSFTEQARFRRRQLWMSTPLSRRYARAPTQRLHSSSSNRR